MNVLARLFRRPEPPRAASPRLAPPRLRGEDPTRLLLESLPSGRDVVASRDGAPLAILRAPPGAMLLEVLPLRDAVGRTVLVGALFRLEQRHGLLVRWDLEGAAPGPLAGRVLFEGSPESVLWRLREEDGDVLARDTRHRTLWRVALDGSGGTEVSDPAPLARSA